MSNPTDANPGPRIRWRRLIVIASLTLTVAAVAFVMVLRWAAQDEAQALVIRQRPPEAPAAPQVRVAGPGELKNPGRPIGDDEPAFWSDVAIYKAGKDRPRPIVVVKRGEQPTESGDRAVYQGLLAREIVRQGLLLTAREEFGASTRDVPIGDADVAGKPDATFRIGSRIRTMYGYQPDDPPDVRITIVQGKGASRRVLLSREFECGITGGPHYSGLVWAVETFTRDGFPAVFKDLGLGRTTPVSAKRPADAPLPPEIEKQLDQPILTEQFAAVRALHRAIRDEGETPSRLIGLARGYANLGSLTETRWTADYLAFQARALLYAQRIDVREKDAPATLRAQAYAEAVAGLFVPALHDIELAEKADGGKSAPIWAELAKAYAGDDAEALKKLAEARPDDPWPLYFRFLTLARASGWVGAEDRTCRGEIIAAGRDILAKVPDCYRIHDGMAEVGGVNNLHSATSVAFELFPTAMPKRLRAVPGLPDSAMEPISGGRNDEVEFRRRLTAAATDDRDELSWGVLARQLEEIRFLQVCQRLHFLAYNLGVSPAEFAAEALPVIADHRNRAYVACAAGLVQGTAAGKLVKALDTADVERKAAGMILGIRSFDPALSARLDDQAYQHLSAGTVPAQETFVKVSAAQTSYNAAHVLLNYDPESPFGRSVLIQANWQEAQPKAAEWQADHGGDTSVIAAMGFQMLAAGQDEEAEKLFEKAMAQSPDRWIFDGLAAAYRKTGRVDRWKAAVAEFLKSEDQNLDHAHITGDLADYLMEQGDFAGARPFAELSASSWAGWAMPKAARCAEELKDWEAAELWTSRTSQRYAVSWADWFYWCKRTGHGNARAAADLVESQLAAGRSFSSPYEEFCIAILLMLDGRPQDAQTLLQRRFDKDHDTTDGILLAEALDQQGDAKARDAVLKSIAENPTPSGPLSARIVKTLGDWLAGDQKAPPDLKAIDAVLGEMPPEGRPNACAFIGVLLSRSAQKEASRDYLDRANVKDCFPWVRFLVMDALRAQGIDPGHISL